MRPIPGTSISLWSNLASRGGERLAIVGDWLGGTGWREVVGGDRGSATLILPIDSPAVQHAAIYNVIRIDDPLVDGTVRTWEYRITAAKDGLSDPIVTVTGAPVICDYGRFQIRTVVAGVPSKLVSIAEMRPADILTTVFLPALAAEGITDVSIGTVAPTGTLSLSQRNLTPLALLAWLEQQTLAEAWLERDGESGWILHLGTQGDDAERPVVWVGRNVTRLDHEVIVDDEFANRVEPDGETMNGAESPTHCGHAMWSVADVTSNVVTLADPHGGPGPIAVDGQFVGNELVWPLDPLHFPDAPGSATSIAVDTTRRVIWVANSSALLYWVEIETGVAGTLAVSGATNIPSVAYVAATDRIYASCQNAGKVEIIDAATKTSVGSVSISGSPSRLSVIPAKGYVCVANADGTSDIAVINTSSNTVAGSLSSTATFTHVTYHAGTDRLFVWSIGSSNFRRFNATTLAFVGEASVPFLARQVCDDPTQTAILVVDQNGNYATVNPSTGAASSSTARSTYSSETVTPLPGLMPRVGSTYYIITATKILPFDGSALVGSAGDVASSSSSLVWAVESSTATPYLYVTAGEYVRYLALTTAPAPFDHAEIIASNATAQTVTLPAAGSGGPSHLPVGTRVQIRDDDTFAYHTRLSHPDSVATYGPIDASPSFGIVGLANYWRGGTFDEWRSDDTARWASLSYPAGGISSFGLHEQRWRAADQTALTAHPITIASNYTTGDLTISLSGLGAGRVLQPGDVIHNNVSFASASFIGIVRGRAVADGSGAAIVPISPVSANLSSGAAFLTTPALNLPQGQTDCLVFGSSNPSPPFGLAAAIPVLYLPNDATAWVVAHLQLHLLSAEPNNVRMDVRPPFSSSSTVRPGDTALVSGELRSYWLAQRVDLATNHGTIGVRFAVDTGGGLHRQVVVYVQSLAVIVSPVSTVDDARDVYGAEGANGLWQAANARLRRGATPSQRYQVVGLEDDPGAPFVLGATTIVRDAARGIAASPRVISVTYTPSRPDTPFKQPQIELATLPPSAVASLVALQVRPR